MALNKESSEVLSSVDHGQEQVLLLNNRFTIREKYCQLAYKIRTFKNKGAILFLTWNIDVMNLLYYLLTQTSLEGVHFIALLFMLPIARWLADVYLRRYKVIQWGMRIMWIGSVLATLSSVVAQLVDSYESINKKVTAAIILQTIGFAGYQTNIFQFGIDQFPDASTNAIKSFISCFVWSYFTQLKKVCSLTHGVLFLKCDLIQNKLKVEQTVHSWELYTVYNFSVCVCKLFCTLCPFPKSSQ